MATGELKMELVTGATRCAPLQETGLQKSEGWEAGSFPCELTDFARSWQGCLDSLHTAILPALTRSACVAEELCFSSADRSQVSLDDFADAGVAHKMT